MIQKIRFAFASFVLITILSVTLSARAQTSTPTPAITKPSVSISSAPTTLQIAAILYANITADGGSTVTVRGFNFGLTTNYGATTSTSGSYTTGIYSLNAVGLSCATTYHYRAFAINAGGTGVSSDSTFTTSACPTATPTAAPIAKVTLTVPTVSPIGETTATLNGSISSIGGGNATVVGFNYGLTSTYTTTVSTNGSYGTVAFSNNISDLTCGTTYHFRSFAINPGGTATSSDQTFTTTACPTSTPTATGALAPTLAVPTASSIDQTTVTLNGNITATGGANATIRGFNYGLTSSYTSTVSTSGSYGTGAYSQNLTGLTCGTLYHYRAFATGPGGTTNTADQTFTTTACSTAAPTATPAPTPSVTTVSATSIGEASAVMNGNITDTGVVGLSATRRGFQYGEGSYSEIICEDGTFSAGAYNRTSNTTCGAITASVLSCGTTYQYRAFAVTTNGTGYGDQETFTTNACPTPTSTPTPEPTSNVSNPTIINLTISSTTPTSAIFGATLQNTGNSDVTERGFYYGKTFAMGSTTNQTSGPYAVGEFAITTGNLSCGTTYYVQGYALNVIGPTLTEQKTFETSACPTPTPTPAPQPPVVSLVASASNITRNSVTLSGSITSGTAVERGFEYGLNTNYGTETKQTDSYGAGAFSLNVTGLTPDRVYHFRAYAKNAGGTASSSDYTFRTNASPGNLTGWAWSSNIGWLNLDSITIDQDTGDLNGYAWSNNIGWVKFGGLSDFPGGAAPGVNANINFDTGEVKGWIRACAGTVGGETNTTGATCVSMDSRTDGWDGWIELSGQNHTSLASALKNKFWDRWVASAQGTRMQGLKLDVATGIVSGMAWGGPVIGWLNFNADTDASSLVSFNASCSAIKVNDSLIRFTATPTGGDGSYEYAWNGSATYGADETFDKAYAGAGNSSVALNVREVGKNEVLSPTCSYTQPPGITINTDPPCTVDPRSALVGDKVTFSVGNPSPPGTYKYYWLTGDGSNLSSDARTFDYIYASAGEYKNVGVIVTNLSNQTQKTFLCGNVNISNKELKLFIGASQDDINAKVEGSKKSYITKKGDPFALQWVNTLDKETATNPGGYTCEKLLDNKTDDEWVDSWILTANVNNSNKLEDNTSVVGTYNIGIKCTSPSLIEKTDNVILKVISSTVKEI